MERHELRFPVMGTEAHLVALGGPAELLDRARRRLETLEARWSRFLVDSEITRLNRSSGEPIVVSPDTFRVVSAAIEAWRWSNGRFDPTVATTMDRAGYDRWRRANRAGGLPPTGPGPIDHPAIEHWPAPGPDGIALDPYPGSVAVPAGVSLDLGAIGKGAAADLVVGDLLAAGAAGCCANLGGDVRVAGQPPGPEGWRVAIDTSAGGPSLSVGVVDGAVCTSTTVGRHWTGELGPEHHVREPATGRPLATGLRAVTVVGARAMQAEVLATTALSAGPLEAPEIITGVGATGVLVTDEGEAIELAGLAPFRSAAELAGTAT